MAAPPQVHMKDETMTKQKSSKRRTTWELAWDSGYQVGCHVGYEIACKNLKLTKPLTKGKKSKLHLVT
jgi:hypothetical protein